VYTSNPSSCYATHSLHASGWRITKTVAHSLAAGRAQKSPDTWSRYRYARKRVVTKHQHTSAQSIVNANGVGALQSEHHQLIAGIIRRMPCITSWSTISCRKQFKMNAGMCFFAELSETGLACQTAPTYCRQWKRRIVHGNLSQADTRSNKPTSS
jgi:hypothetical protein